MASGGRRAGVGAGVGAAREPPPLAQLMMHWLWGREGGGGAEASVGATGEPPHWHQHGMHWLWGQEGGL